MEESLLKVKKKRRVLLDGVEGEAMGEELGFVPLYVPGGEERWIAGDALENNEFP
jgi:hypothetical protein